MTMPIERTRSLIQAGAFLRQIEAEAGVSKQLREEARRLLRHFPSVSDVEAIASNEAHLLALTKSRLLQTYLVVDIDQDWLRGYSRGPHIGG